jgi:geranylgeranyl transferase type-2 subunit beta
MTEHLRIQGVFWALGSLDLLGLPNPRESEIAAWVMTCYDEKRGGFGGNTKHDAHILYTQHAVYVLAQCHALDMMDEAMTERVVAYVKSMQKPDGSFAGGASSSLFFFL